MSSMFSPNKRSYTLAIVIALSILLHLLFLLLMIWGMKYGTKNEAPPQQEVWINLKPPVQEKPIVDIPKPKKEEVPDKPSAESLYSQKVKEETVAPSSTPAKPQPPVQPSKTPKPKKEEPKKETSAPKENIEPQKKFDELYGKRSPDILQQAPAMNIPGGYNEYLPSYKVGNKTYLNTEANPQIGYFVQLKRKFQLGFNPTAIIRQYINQIPGSSIRVTLGMSINARGELVDLIVIKPSGLAPYDEVSKQTVRGASPFSSPPPNLLGPDGLMNVACSFTVHLR